MKTLVKIIAIILIVFGAIVTLGGIGVMIDNPNDMALNIIMILIFGVTPVLGGVLILRRQRNKTKIEVPQPQTVERVEDVIIENQNSTQQEQTQQDDLEELEETSVSQSESENNTSKLTDIFPIRALKNPNFFQQLFKTTPKINAIIEINNLLGTKYLRDIKANEILEICTKYKTNLRGNLLKNAKELYSKYLEKCLKDFLLTDDENNDLAHLGNLLLLQGKEVAELHNKLTGEIYKRIYDETLSGSKLGKYNEEYLDKLKKDIKLPDEIADKISNDCRQNYLLGQFARIRENDKISPDGWKEFTEISKNLNITLESDPASDARIERMKLNWLIEHGELPVKQVSINLPANEYCYYFADIEWLETRKVTKRVNYHGPTARIKIAKGIYYRAGSIAPQRITEDELQVIDRGTVYITNKRIVFTGGGNNKSILISKILSITPYTDGVGVEKDSGKSPILKVSKDADILAMILARVIKDY